MKLEKQKSAHLLLTLKPALGEGKATLPPVRPQPSGEGRNPPAPPADRPPGAAALATTGNAGFILVLPISQPNPTFKLLGFPPRYWVGLPGKAQAFTG